MLVHPAVYKVVNKMFKKPSDVVVIEDNTVYYSSYGNIDAVVLYHGREYVVFGTDCLTSTGGLLNMGFTPVPTNAVEIKEGRVF